MSAARLLHLTPPLAYQRTGIGPRRHGESVRYGTVAPLVREAIDREGVIEVTAWARANGLPYDGVAGVCKREARDGRAVRMLSAYWRPDLAEKVKATIAAARKEGA